ncbi:MAG: TolC family protein [Candidatus Riflebacteria bacterium]|nr:TolC family protein [Candidatus Riflebacteria bacterium]
MKNLIPLLLFVLVFYLVLGSIEVRAVPLATLIDRALANNLALKMEKLRIEEQAFDEKRTENAMIPNLDGSLSHQRQSYVDPSPAAFFGSQYYQTVFSFQLVQKYPALGRIPRIDRDLARLRTQYQKTVADRFATELRRQVIRLFFDLLQERELAKVDEENIGLLRQLLEVARINRDVGLALPNDILRIEAQKANLESSLTTRGFLQENFRIDLANLLNIENQSELEIDLPPSIVFPLSQPQKATILEALLKKDHDIELARQDVAIVRLAVDSARSANLPSLNLGGQYNFTDAKGGNRNARDYGVSMSLDFPIFDSGDHKNNVLKANKMMARLELALENLTKLKKAALNKAWTDYQEMAPKLNFAQIAVAQSFENMRMIVTRYRHGDATIVELVDAQITMSSAAQNAVKIHHDERIRLSELYILSQDPAIRGVDAGAVSLPKFTIETFETAPVPPESGLALPQNPLPDLFQTDIGVDPGGVIYRVIINTTRIVNTPFGK